MTGGRHVALAAGGTGGHLFPAMAVAQELERRGYQVTLATDARGERYATGIADVRRVSSGGSGGGLGAKMGAGLAICAGFAEAWLLLRRLGPAGVVGFGGYPSVPTMLAAIARGLPTLIHEQNAVLGRANRLVARRVSAVATSFESVERLGPAGSAAAASTGNPVRESFSGLRSRAYQAPDGDDGAIRLLVLGGSQGAHAFSEVVPAALLRLPEDVRRRLSVVQQCRAEDLEGVAGIYRDAGIDADLASFFDDAAERVAGAHLVIARAGASTVAELAEVGRPAILVPYPHAADDHQTANARAMEMGGGAWLMSPAAFDPGSLATRIGELARRPELLRTAAAAMRAMGGRDAARALADRFEGLLDGAGGRAP